MRSSPGNTQFYESDRAGRRHQLGQLVEPAWINFSFPGQSHARTQRADWGLRVAENFL